MQMTTETTSKTKTEVDAFAPWGADRRVAVRTPSARQVLIYPCRNEGLGRAVRCSMSDTSSTGVGLTCLGRLTVGAHFVLRLDQPGGAPPLLQVFKVVRCRDAGGGACLVGAQFERVFTGANPAAANAKAAG